MNTKHIELLLVLLIIAVLLLAATQFRPYQFEPMGNAYLRMNQYTGSIETLTLSTGEWEPLNAARPPAQRLVPPLADSTTSRP